jgi:hypothetical protein
LWAFEQLGNQKEVQEGAQEVHCKKKADLKQLVLGFEPTVKPQALFL